MGLPKARTDEKCYVYAQIPATPGYENCPKIGFIAHLDTASDFCDKKIVPVVTENYDGRDLPLGGSDGRVLSVSMFPHLKDLKGRTLITSNGDTILGADDKAGVAEIMTMAERVLTENIPHGQISIGFTPDEEIGMGASAFDVAGFGADFAYTLDGGDITDYEYETFNAAKTVVTINGFSIHPGSSKDKMKNALLIAMEYNALLPALETPPHGGYEASSTCRSCTARRRRPPWSISSGTTTCSGSRSARP